MNKVYKYLLAIAALAAAGFGIYEYTAPDKYQYWKELIAKDPKPDGVSEQEYREKLRAGYCWRDRKFYTSEELLRKAMVSFAGRLLGEAEAFRTDSTTLQGEISFTGGQCRAYQAEKACSIWFSTKGYSNDQWDKQFLAEERPADFKFLEQYLDKEIKQTKDLERYLSEHGNKKFSLIDRWMGKEGASVYGSDCCRVLDKKMAAPVIGGKEWSGYFELSSVFPENNIPKGVNIQDYGIGNFYFDFRDVVPMNQTDWGKDEKKTYQSKFPTILMMNNCGDILWLSSIVYEI